MAEISRRTFLGLDSIIDNPKSKKIENDNEEAPDEKIVRRDVPGSYIKELYIALLEGYYQKE